jgi:hypothetical protein
MMPVCALPMVRQPSFRKQKPSFARSLFGNNIDWSGSPLALSLLNERSGQTSRMEESCHGFQQHFSLRLWLPQALHRRS